MTWLTWRQFRGQAAATGGTIALLLIGLAASAAGLRREYRADGASFLTDLSGGYRALYLLGALAVLALPVLIGLFWGAPLITRELDAGTHRLIWTKVTRTRWLATKLGLIGLAAFGAAGLLSLAVTWWSAPIDQAIAETHGLPAPGLLVFARLSPELFDSRGIAPAGYAAFAFVLGVTIGAVLRRTLAAMAVFLVVFLLTQVVYTNVVRPNLFAPDQVTTTITSSNLLSLNIAGSLTVVLPPASDWISGQNTIDATGHASRPPSWLTPCMMRSGQPDQPCLTRLARQGYRQRVSYQPASRFWPLQLAETCIYLLFAALLAGACRWWTRRRLC